jgi:Zn-dependent protease
MFSGGWFTVARWRGIPIKIHWSAPLGAFLWTGGSPSLARIGAWLFMIVVHELGHAVLVKHARAHVTHVTVHGMGGECWWQGDVTPIQRAMIAFGGVWAQCLLALGAYGFALAAQPSTQLGLDLFEMFTRYNLYNAAFNLVPVPPLDGSQAWKLFPLLWKRLRYGRLESQRARNAREMRQIQKELKVLLGDAAKKANENAKKKESLN